MPTLERLEAQDLRAVIVSYRDALRVHQERLNRLNVYPVPDGDTGTNMALTLESVVEAMPAGDDLAALCRAIARGSLLGARGNSGVILSQLLGGIAQIATTTPLDAAGIAAALHRASELADAAVARPVEGTILSVARHTATVAAESASTGATLLDVLLLAAKGGAEALDRTPEQLPALAEAGVVDAGGAGYLLLLDSLLHVVDGRPLPEAAEQPLLSATTLDLSAPGHGDISDLRYEVMYLLEADEPKIDDFKARWMELGDSIVVVGNEGMYNCHIHTDEIGLSIEAALDAGRPSNIRVTDLLDQVDAELHNVENQSQNAPAETVTTAVVAVAAGAGNSALLSSLGVQHVVSGGQSMNPSTAELLAAVESVPADSVIVLPNNKNIVAVANKLDGLTMKNVIAIPTRSVQESLSALLEYDPNSDIQENVSSMIPAAARVRAGEVTQAVRDAVVDGNTVSQGQWLSVVDGSVISAEDELDDALIATLRGLRVDDAELVTIIEGEAAQPAVTNRCRTWLESQAPKCEVEVHVGGQPLYPYLIGAE